MKLSFLFLQLRKNPSVLTPSSAARTKAVSEMLSSSFSSTRALPTELGGRIHYFDEVTSTMDKAREILRSKVHLEGDLFAVTAAVQTNGRGTKGRSWASSAQNLYMTVAVPISKIRIPFSLIPLKVGTLIAPCIRRRVDSASSVVLKWPNDVLIDNKKMCGVLIEIENGTVLVGVGCNVDRAPAIESTGIDGGREAVSLREVWKDRNAASPDSFDSRQECFSLSQDIFQSFSAWIEGGVGGGLGAETGEDVIEVFQAWMDMSPQILRREYSSRHSSPGGAGAGAGVMDGVESKTSKGDEVEPLGIESDGTLRVRDRKTGIIKSLAADYLW